MERRSQSGADRAQTGPGCLDDRLGRAQPRWRSAAPRRSVGAQERGIRVPLGVKQGIGHRHRADPIDQTVVDLEPQRPAAVGETVDQNELPQWPGAVKGMREEVGEPVAQLIVVAGGGERRVRDMVGDVEALVVDPLRP